MKQDRWGRDPRTVWFWGWVTAVVTALTVIIVFLIDMPWSKCHC